MSSYYFGFSESERQLLDSRNVQYAWRFTGEAEIRTELVKTLRTGFGLTQITLAKAVDASNNAVNNWELNLRRPDMKYIESMAELFDVHWIIFMKNLPAVIQHLKYREACRILNAVRKGVSVKKIKVLTLPQIIAKAKAMCDKYKINIQVEID